MKGIITALLIFVASGIIEAQSYYEDYHPGSTLAENVAGGTNTRTKYLENRFRFQLNMGSSFYSYSKDNYFFNTYIAPQVNYRLTEKLSIEAGVIASMPVADHLNNQDSYIHYLFHPMPQDIIYSSAKYNVNQKLTLRGTAFKQLSNFQRNMNSPYWRSANIRGYSIGMRYNITNSITFDAEMQIIEHTPSYYPFPQSNFNQ